MAGGETLQSKYSLFNWETSNGRNSSKQSGNPILRPGDLVGHRQQPEQRYEVLTVDEQRLLVVRWPELALRLIDLRDVVVPF